MEKKPQEQPSRPVKPQKRNDGILLPVLIAAVAGFACFLIVLGVGGMALPTQTAANSTASPSNRGTLPTQKPSSAVTTTAPAKTDAPEETVRATQGPSDAPVEPTEAPANTQAPPAQTNPTEATKTPTQPVQTRQPTAQNPGPVVSVQPTVPTAPPAQQAQTPAQPSNSGNSGNGTTANGDGTYTHDFSGGRMLGTINSDKYHRYDCRAAKTIPPENCVWYNSENDAIAASRSRCGICWR